MTHLRRAARSSSRGIYASIGADERLGLPPTEDVLTHRLLTSLRRATPTLRVTVISRRAEARIGAAWIWCWTGPSGCFCCLMQASRIHDGTDNPVGRTGTRQVDSLLAAAERLHMPAAYALYSGDANAGSSHLCRNFGARRDSRGVSVASAHVVLRCVEAGRTDASAVQAFAVPLPCYFCNPPVALPGCEYSAVTAAVLRRPGLAPLVNGLALGCIAARAAFGTLESVGLMRFGQFSQTLERVEKPLGDVPDPAPIGYRPVASVLRGYQSESPGWLTAVRAGERPLDDAVPGLSDLPNVAGVIVLEQRAPEPHGGVS